jgi:hypothetical protein
VRDHPHLPLSMHLSEQPGEYAEEVDQKVQVVLEPPESPDRSVSVLPSHNLHFSPGRASPAQGHQQNHYDDNQYRHHEGRQNGR